MPTEQQLQSALKNAHKAGDTPAAKALANALKAGQFDAETETTAASILEPAATIASGIISEPVAGVIGAAAAPFVGAEGAEFMINDVRDRLTYSPRTPEGQAGLQKVGEVMEPVTEAVKALEEGIGDAAFKATDSPVVGAAGQTVPTAALMALGAGGVRRGLRGSKIPSKTKIFKEAAPTKGSLEQQSAALYRQLDESGARVRAPVMQSFVERMNNLAQKNGIDPTLHPQATAALKRIDEFSGVDTPIGKIDTLRQIMSDAAGSSSRGERRIATLLIKEIDDTLDKMGSGLALKGGDGLDVGATFKQARGLFQRARKAETIEKMMSNAAEYEAGFERGLRAQFRNFLKNDKKKRGFTQEEIKAMRDVSGGGSVRAIVRTLGKLGFTTDQATRLMLPSAGIVAGSTLGGGAGAVAVPLIGTLSERLATRLTRGSAERVSAIVRAGKDGNKIYKAYISRTKPNQRSASDLAELFMARGADVDNFAKNVSKLPKNQQSMAGDVVFLSNFIQSQKQAKQ